VSYEELEAIEGVRAIIVAYTESCDAALLDEWRATFLDDGVLQVKEAIYRGKDIDLLFRARVGTKLREREEGRRTRHHLTSQGIKIQADGSANAWTYFQLLRNGEMEETGIYFDQLRRNDDGAWKLAHRNVIVEYRSAKAPPPERPIPLQQR
jgi:3-phenylpropionate/cinnamic acid dioxygenase small subunit